MGMFQSCIQPVIDSLDVRLVLDDKALLNVTEINECLAMTFLFKKAIYLEGKVFFGEGGEGGFYITWLHWLHLVKIIL